MRNINCLQIKQYIKLPNRELNMKELALQLVTVELENGKQGVFIGGPLITDDYTNEQSQVESVWFSDIQEFFDYYK